MRVLLQRATWGRVSVAGEVIGQLPRPGLVADLSLDNAILREVSGKFSAR